MDKLTLGQVQHIFIAAATRPILILTVTKDTAAQIRGQLVEFAFSRYKSNIRTFPAAGYVTVYGLERIRINSADTWVNDEKRLPFSGLCLITNSKLAGAPGITGEIMTISDFFEKAI